MPTPHQNLMQRLARTGALPSSLASAGRMYIVGKNVYYPDGRLFVPRGVNIGQTELYQPGDMFLIAAAGFNAVRIVVRKFGTYGDTNLDSDAGAATTTNVMQAYFDRTVDRIIEAKRAGLVVLLAPDSNCGQFERVGDATCDLGYGSPQTFWTAGGATKRAEHKNSVAYYIRTCRGLIDIVEIGCVEPNPTTSIPTGNTTTDIQSFQHECRQAYLAEDPAILLMVGGKSYYNNSLANWYRADWVGNTIWTCNELSNAMSGAGFSDDVANIVAFRNSANVPVHPEQCGTTVADDPDDSLLIAGLGALNTASGGSIGWWFWEMVSKGTGNGYGWLTANMPDPTVRALNATRLANLQALAVAPATPA